MRKILLLLAITLLSALVGLFTTPASAQSSTQTWISGTGVDVNPCSRTAPCKTWAGAIAKTASGGEIDALDPGAFGAVTVTKAITLANEGVGEAGILASGTNGVTVDCTDPNCTVVLRGLQIDGGPIGLDSLAGVKFVAGGTLIIKNSAIRNFTGGAPDGYGVSFTPSGASSLFMSDTVISTNGLFGSTHGGGIFIQPQGSGSANVSLTRLSVSNNTFGIRADGSAGSGPTMLSITDCVVSSNVYAGMVSFGPAGTGATTVTIDRTTSSNNGTGLNANGANAILRIGNSVVAGNTTGVAISNGANMSSLGTNDISNNTASGPSVPIVGPN